jgi:hypothetical protein
MIFPKSRKLISKPIGKHYLYLVSSNLLPGRSQIDSQSLSPAGDFPLAAISEIVGVVNRPFESRRETNRFGSVLRSGKRKPAWRARDRRKVVADQNFQRKKAGARRGVPERRPYSPHPPALAARAPPSPPIPRANERNGDRGQHPDRPYGGWPGERQTRRAVIATYITLLPDWHQVGGTRPASGDAGGQRELPGEGAAHDVVAGAEPLAELRANLAASHAIENGAIKIIRGRCCRSQQHGGPFHPVVRQVRVHSLSIT